MKNIAYVNPIDHLVFGEWWKYNYEGVLRGVNRDKLIFYKSLIAENFSSPGPYHFGENKLINNSNSDFSYSFIINLLNLLENEFGESREIVANDFSGYLDRWKFLGDNPLEIINSLKNIYKYNLPGDQASIIKETDFIFSPPSLKDNVDLACFVPMPDSHNPVILLNPQIIKNFSKDKMFRMKMSLIFAHEVVGHAVQHRLQVIDNTDGMFLDYELMEGCGILAEGSLRLFGDFGQVAATLYKVKRLLPFAFTMRDNPIVYQKIISFKEIWPDFFYSSDFNIFRRSTRRHSEGMLKTYLELNDSSSFYKINPWKMRLIHKGPERTGRSDPHIPPAGSGLA